LRNLSLSSGRLIAVGVGGGRHAMMLEIEWQIMLEQFVASAVVVKDEIINIDSD
jgi:hypothetical protein